MTPMKLAFGALATLFIVATGLAQASDQCPPDGYSRSDLLQLKEAGFALEDEARRNELAITLTGCLADPDPAIRDGVVFEGLSAWMRGEQLTESSRQALLEITLSKLTGHTDSEGFRKPFAALVLSEVVRTDRINAWMSPQQRQEVASATSEYLAGITDYRGFSETQGWRHGVAHGSDLVLQLVLNDAIDASAITRLMDAILMQVAPVEAHFYIYGEPGRLARAVTYAWGRGVVEETYWTQWFDQIAQPAPLENWGSSFSSQQGLAKRHNTLNFLKSLHLNAVFFEDEDLAEKVITAIRKVTGN